MTSLMRGVFVVGGKRTAFGTFGGKLKDTSITEMTQIASKAAITAANVTPDKIDSVTVGCVNLSTSADGAYLARHTALRVGCPVHVPCLVVNRLCGSGFQSVVTAAQDICLRESEIALAASAENMSQSPFVMRNARFGVKLSQAPDLECSLWSLLTDSYIKTPMANTAENLADKYKISREECDKYALQSHQRWARAQNLGRFDEEIVPIVFKNKKTGQDEVFKIDEHPKPQSTLEGLAQLPTLFKKNGTVTAGNASGVCDGAAALVLASEDAVSKNNLNPYVRIVGYCSVGCDPNIMGIGPVPAIRKLCERTGISLDKVDLVDVNEAFAPQFLAVQKELKLDNEKTNVNGGAIALGHPVGASGGRILINLMYELLARDGKYAIGAACIGGGQGIAVMLENIKK